MPKGGSWWLDFYGFVRIFTAAISGLRDAVATATENVEREESIANPEATSHIIAECFTRMGE